MSREDLYIILEIGRTASVNEIKKAFRRLARRFHPDINPGDRSAEERFKRISEAYEILSDPLKRQFYDENGFYAAGVFDQQQRGWGFSFQGFDFNRPNNAHFGEIFGQFFTSRAMRREPERGQDLEYPVSISFEESLRGLKTRISLLRKSPCDSCKGNGRAVGAPESACVSCGGSGRTTRIRGHLQFAVTCADCAGSGQLITACRDCGGEGRVPVTEIVDVDLPPGAGAGSRIRIAGKGDAGRFGGPTGDLYVVTNTASHPFLSRFGDNLHCTVPVTVSEAALGAKIEVPTIDGTATLRIPPGTQSGQTLRLRGKGMPSLLNPELRGDQYVEIRVVVPRVADERSKEILRELAKLNPENPRKSVLRDAVKNGP